MLRDLMVATIFLTRLPARVEPPPAMHELAGAAYLFPVVGAVVGAIGGAAFLAATYVGLTSLPAGIIALAALVLATGALHEDGLADTADALGAGTNRARALEIMRDSRIGSFGTIALVLTLLARLSALATLWDPFAVAAALVAAGAVSRAAVPAVMWRQPNARGAGLAADAGRPTVQAVGIAAALGAAVALACLPYPDALVGCAVAALVAVAVAGWLGARFGGCTGDTLGAVQQLTETAFLLSLVAGR
ncbi:MAG: adenosylcobinamide-GDP ribazoletransferase [Geminicoccaceae bacterium]